MIQCFNTRARVLKRARGVILSINIIFNRCKGSSLRSLGEFRAFIISLTHSLLIDIDSLTLRLHSTEQYIHKHNTNYTITKYTCNTNYINWLALNMIQRFNTRARVLRRTRDVILSSNIIFNSLQRVYWALATGSGYDIAM